jgi:hypothetical protein
MLFHYPGPHLLVGPHASVSLPNPPPALLHHAGSPSWIPSRAASDSAAPHSLVGRSSRPCPLTPFGVGPPSLVSDLPVMATHCDADWSPLRGTPSPPAQTKGNRTMPPPRPRSLQGHSHAPYLPRSCTIGYPSWWRLRPRADRHDRPHLVCPEQHAYLRGNSTNCPTPTLPVFTSGKPPPQRLPCFSVAYQWSHFSPTAAPHAQLQGNPHTSKQLQESSLQPSAHRSTVAEPPLQWATSSACFRPIFMLRRTPYISPTVQVILEYPSILIITSSVATSFWCVIVRPILPNECAMPPWTHRFHCMSELQGHFGPMCPGFNSNPFVFCQNWFKSV